MSGLMYSPETTSWLDPSRVPVTFGQPIMDTYIKQKTRGMYPIVRIFLYHSPELSIYERLQVDVQANWI